MPASFGGGAGAVWPGSAGGGSSMVLQAEPTKLEPLVVAGGGGGAGSFDETPGNWNGVNICYAGSSVGFGNALAASNFPSTLIGGQNFSGGLGASLATRTTRAGRATNQLPETVANEFGSGVLLDTQNAQTTLVRTGGLSIQGGGGGGGGLVGGGAGCAIIKDPKSATGGGGGLS